MLTLPERPHSPEVERAALGCMMLGDLIDDPALGIRTNDCLSPEDFHDPRHRESFAAIRSLIEAGRAVNLLALIERLNATGRMDEAGGVVYVSSLGDELPVGYRATEYVETLRDYTGRRRLVEYGERIALRATRESAPAVSQVAEAQTALATIEQQTCELGGEAVTVHEAIGDLGAYLDRDRGSVLGLPTGIPKLDALTMGFQPGQVIVVAGGTGGGKTAFVTDFIAHQHERTGTSGVVYSLEMSERSMAFRLVARLSSVEHDAILRGHLTPYDRHKVLTHYDELRERQWIRFDSKARTPGDVLARARRLKVAHGIGYVIVDYLQLMEGSGRSENRQLEIAAASRAMKRMAVELELPVLLLSQLNREGMKTGERPRLHHLRESGAIEQDADVVLFVHYPSEADKTSDRRAVELIVEKNRSGPVGIVEAEFFKPTFRFRELDTHHQGAVA